VDFGTVQESVGDSIMSASVDAIKLLKKRQVDIDSLIHDLLVTREVLEGIPEHQSWTMTDTDNLDELRGACLKAASAIDAIFDEISGVKS
jgi:hypothetical protein